MQVSWNHLYNTLQNLIVFLNEGFRKNGKTRSSWFNRALQDDDEAVYWVSIGHYEVITVGN